MSDLRLRRHEVLALHEAAIARFGGARGVRDLGMLESALAQPHQTFGGKELYPTVEEKAARYAFGLCRNHPFVDGNKRVAAACLGAYLRLEGRTFRPSHEGLLSVMLGVAGGSVDYESLLEWVRAETSHEGKGAAKRTGRRSS